MLQNENGHRATSIAVVEGYLRSHFSDEISHKPYGKDPFEEIFTVGQRPPLRLVVTQLLLALPNEAEKIFAGPYLAARLKRCADQGKVLWVTPNGDTECKSP